MVDAETLPDGSLRLKGKSCVFLYTRLKPGVMLTTISGFDTGDLGNAPLEAITAEYKRFARPVEWFVNAADAINATNETFGRWTDWLMGHQSLLKGMHVLTGTRPAQLTIEIARHLSRTHNLMCLYEGRPEFEAVIADRVPGFHGLPPESRLQETGARLARRVLPDGSVELRSGDLSFTYKALSPVVVLTTVSGVDKGGLGTAALDEMQARIADSPQPIEWFLDASATQQVAPRVTEEWAEWLAAHQRSLQRLHVLTGAGAYMPHTLTVAKFRSRSGELMRIYRDSSEFRAALAARVPDADC